MSAEQVALEQKPHVAERTKNGHVQPRSSRRWKWGWMAATAILLGSAGVGGAYLIASGKEHSGSSQVKGRSEPRSQQLRVQVVNPQHGGMERTTSQPGTIRAFDYAELYAKVSGFVKTLNVDRGSVVKKGQVLLEIYDPERDVAVLQAQAAMAHSKAVVDQARTTIMTAEAAVNAAVANQKTAAATRDQRVAQRDYRKKEYERISDLVARKSVEERLKDEQLDEYHSAQAAVDSAEAGIETAAAQLAEAKAKVEKAKADLKAAQAQVLIAEANLKMAQVLVQYTRIESPYDGVVIFRGDGVHTGAFVRAADIGTAGQPLLTVAMTAKMRTIVPVPDRDAPYCDVGDPATVTLDALAGRVFHGKVNRTSESQNITDRLMRVEIDLPNSDGVLRDGMFGRAEILLEKTVKNLTVPSSCLIDRNGKGDGAVMVVKDGKVRRVNVHVGMDTGVRAEITRGIAEDDQIILQPDPSLPEGTQVQVELVTGPPGEHSPGPGS
jgi:RND family efflux transporter MFP subunit